VLTATSVNYGCVEDFTIQLPIRPAPKGEFSIADTDVCVPEQIEITNSSNILSGTFTSQWDFGDGTTLINDDPTLTHSFSSPRQYKVTLTRTSDYGCTNSFSRTVIVHPDPVPSFVPVSACEGKEIVFYNNSVISAPDLIQSYSWDFGGNATSSLAAPKHIFPGYGTYNVGLTATSNYGCTSTYVGPVTVYRNPVFNLGANVTACQTPFTLNPADDANAFLPAASTFTWFNNQQQAIGNTMEYEANSSGVYRLRIVTPSPEFCQAEIAVPLFLFHPANLGDDLTACSAIVIDAEANLPGEKLRAEETTYEWRRNNVLLSTNQTFNVLESGTYQLTITRTVGGVSCSSSDEVNVTIEVPLGISIPSQQTICQGESLLLEAGVIADSYVWTRLNSGETFEGPTLEVAESGDYQLQVINAGCTAIANTSVIVSPSPTASFTLSSLNVCVGVPFTITDHRFLRMGFR
jgi:PKD repeat protein